MNSLKIRSWIRAARLRTLPLALSSVIMGSAAAVHAGVFSSRVILLTALTTLFLQILSNFANDFGDSDKGTDNEHRLGPVRTVQSGEIGHAEMKKGIVVMSALSLASGIWLLTESLGHDTLTFLVFLALGLGAIAAAIKYVVGKNAYGYRGMGDLFVFLFFGMTGVMGTYYLNTHSLSGPVWLLAFTLGMFSTGVLNLNNMRDHDNDLQHGKITIPVRLGVRKAWYYHLTLIILGWISAIMFSLLNGGQWWQWIYLITLPLFITDLVRTRRVKHARDLDPFLKKLALSTLAFTLLLGLGLII